MLSGQRPFDRETPFATAFSQVQDPPPPLPDDLPEDLALVIEDCLNKDPQQRPPHATAVALRLGLGDNEVMGLGLGLVWSADDTGPGSGSTVDTLPNTIPTGLTGRVSSQPSNGLELAE